MMQRWGQVTTQPAVVAASSAQELLALRQEVDRVFVAPEIHRYILSLVRSTRMLAERTDNPTARRQLNFGASPRASLALFQAGRALAWLRGNDYVSPSLLQELAPDIMRHRLGLTYEAEAEEITTDKIISQIIERTPVPAITKS
jgi:MoxR-like ATPase